MPTVKGQNVRFFILKKITNFPPLMCVGGKYLLGKYLHANNNL